MYPCYRFEQACNKALTWHRLPTRVEVFYYGAGWPRCLRVGRDSPIFSWRFKRSAYEAWPSDSKAGSGHTNTLRLVRTNDAHVLVTALTLQCCELASQ